MKKILMFLAGVMLLTSCGTAESGLINGAAFGSIIGSAVGGMTGGWRGRDVGTLVGMATGAAAGAAIGSANEQSQERAYRQGVRDGRASVNDRYVENHRRELYANQSSSSKPDYSEDAIYDDVITFDAGKPESQAKSDVQANGPVYEHPVMIENVSFINADNTKHIAKGELVKIAFDIRNTTPESISEIVPVVKETTGNKRLLVSQSTMIERLPGRKALRYTAFVSAQKNLKKGGAKFVLSVQSGNKTISNIVEMYVPLD